MERRFVHRSDFIDAAGRRSLTVQPLALIDHHQSLARRVSQLVYY
jgi:hypothetical protein